MNTRKVNRALIGALVILSVTFASGVPSAGPTKKSPKLPGLPEGVKLGMSATDLVALRPKVEVLSLGLRKRPKDLSKLDLKTASLNLFEELKRGKDGKVQAVIIYRIEKGKCTALAHEAEYPQDQLAEKRTSALRACVAALGKKYEKKFIRKHLRGASYLMPVFVWRSDKKIVTLTVTSDYPGVSFTKGIVQINVWTPGDKELEASFEKEKAPKALVDLLFAPLEKSGGKDGGAREVW